MDAVDRKILNCLRENARMNASVIGERVSMSVSAVIERIRKLEASGVIRQYTVVLNPKRLGKDICAFILVSFEHPRYNDSFIESVASLAQITECHYITGDFDFMLKVMTGTTEELTGIINSIKCMKGVSSTRTLVVLSTTKNELSPLPDA